MILGAKIMYRYNVSCSETSTKKWTQSAIDCYAIGCNCSKCGLNKKFFSKSIYRCQMKNTVIELVRKLGKPQMEDEEVYDENY